MPPTITLPAGTSLRPGQQVRIDYYAVNPIDMKQVSACLTAPNILSYLDSNIVAVTGKFPPGAGFLLNIDEVRHVNTCATCLERGETAGGLLSWRLGRCVNVIRGVHDQRSRTNAADLSMATWRNRYPRRDERNLCFRRRAR